MSRVINIVASFAYTTGLVHAAFFVRRTLLRRHGVYVLSYHHVVEDVHRRRSPHDVTVPQLDRHLAFVNRWFKVVGLGEVPALLAGGPLDRDYLAVTFDDGYVDNHRHALPLLHRHGVPATLFLIAGLAGSSELPWYDECRARLPRLSAASVDAAPPSLRRLLASLLSIVSAREPFEHRIGRALEVLKQADHERRLDVVRYLRDRCARPPEGSLQRAGIREAQESDDFRIMSWEQARDMSRHGVTVACHTMTHPLLTRLSAAAIEYEVVASKEAVEQQIGCPVDAFAYPNGEMDHRSADVLRRHGFRVACTQRFGANRPGADPLAIKRIGLGRTSSKVLAAKLSGLFSPAYAVRDRWMHHRHAAAPLPEGSPVRG